MEKNFKDNQHYVFQAYLKAWTDDNNELYEYKKGRTKIIHKGTKKTLSIYRFYKLKELNDDEKRFLDFYMDLYKTKGQNIESLQKRIDMTQVLFKYGEIAKKMKEYFSATQGGLKDYECFDQLADSIDKSIVNLNEDYLGDVEKDGIKWIKRVIQGDLEFYYPRSDCNGQIDNSDKEGFLTFVGIQYMRTFKTYSRLNENVNIILEYFRKTGFNKFDCSNVRAEHVVSQLMWDVCDRFANGLIDNNPHYPADIIL